jgi:hypothetical protein
MTAMSDSTPQNETPRQLRLSAVALFSTPLAVAAGALSN